MVSSFAPWIDMLDIMSVGQRRSSALPRSSAASRLFDATFDTHNPPLIHPYPYRQQHVTDIGPTQNKTVYEEYSLAKKYIGWPDREIFGVGILYISF
jgi:hypothetical protein